MPPPASHRSGRARLTHQMLPTTFDALWRYLHNRRNWLFAGSPRGGRAAAVAYTLIESCRIAKVDIISYLADALVRVATHPASRVEELLPNRWNRLIADELKPQPVLA